MKFKFLVMKLGDISGGLDPEEQAMFHKLGRKIASYRQKTGRKKYARYVVVNMDEPYIDEIIEVMKRNGHWGEDE